MSQKVGEILENTNKNDWRWVPTQQNVADEDTRMNSIISFKPTGRWYSGPSFMKNREEDWSVENNEEASTNADMEIIQFVNFSNDLLFSFKFERHSTLIKLVRVAAWMMRFIDRTRTKSCARSGELTIGEIERGETICIKAAQRECFSLEVDQIRAEEPLGRSSRLFKLCTRLGSDEILRVGGRLDLLDAEENFIHSTIIDGRHHFTTLLLRKYHKLRQKYWILGGQRELKRLKHSSAECIIRKASPEPPLMGQLPRVRLEYGHPPVRCVLVKADSLTNMSDLNMIKH